MLYAVVVGIYRFKYPNFFGSLWWLKAFPWIMNEGQESFFWNSAKKLMRFTKERCVCWDVLVRLLGLLIPHIWLACFWEKHMAHMFWACSKACESQELIWQLSVLLKWVASVQEWNSCSLIIVPYKLFCMPSQARMIAVVFMEATAEVHNQGSTFCI